MRCTPDTGNQPACNEHSNLPGVLFLSRALSVLTATNAKQMISLRLERQEGNEESDRLGKKGHLTPWPVNTTQKSNKNCKTPRAVAEGVTNTLDVDHTSQLQSDQNGVKRNNRPHTESLVPSPTSANQDLMPDLIQFQRLPGT